MKKSTKRQNSDPDYLWSMSRAAGPDESTPWFELLPAAFFTALVILIVRMYTYHRPMEQFYWSTNTIEDNLTDFFSYFKMIAILICAALVLLVLLYRLCSQSLSVKRCFAYIPMLIYSAFVLLSYAFSEYKEFALWGWNDRFEGTLTLLSYMVLLFYIINAVNTERDVKFILYPLVASCLILSIIGIFQSLDMDFFRTTLGQKLIVPNTSTENGPLWQLIDHAAEQGKAFLTFTFLDKQIYQTVYNINYVSFYLTLLIPLFGMLFIRSVNRGKDEPVWKKIGWGVLFAMLIYNLIGSASSGGFLGLAAIGLAGIIILNKRILAWWKPVVILLAIMIATGSITYDRWLPELTGAARGVMDNTAQLSTEGAQSDETTAAAVTPGSIKPSIEYFKTGKRDITISLNNELLIAEVTADASGAVEGLVLKDKEGTMLPMQLLPDKKSTYYIDDDRFRDYMTVGYAYADDQYYVLLNTAEMQWPFAISEDRIYYRNQLGRQVTLSDIPHTGWEDNPHFGSWRGYIWSRTLPLLKDTVLIGHGADTYCIYFPQNDYAGKYTTEFEHNLNIITDKPHNMYLGMAVNTGVVSMLALLAMWVIYIVQSARLYFKNKFDHDNCLTFVGAGIFFGVVGFLVSALVDDSSVSVMPLFYGLLGIGIAVNGILYKAAAKNSVAADKSDKKTV